jgi:pimeloyl-ACP methyl ester carboxylesterase
MPRFRSFDGLSISYLDEGEGPALLLLHGFGSDAERDFGDRGGSSLIEQIASTRRVLAPDLRGHGASDGPIQPAAYAARAMARDLSALMDELDLKSATVVGNSLGAYTAVEFALRDSRVKALCLSGVGPLTAEDVDPWRADELARRGADDPLSAWLQGAVLPQLCVGEFPSVRCPVLVIDAVSDPLDGASFAAGFPHGRLVSIPGDHASVLDQPEWRVAVLSSV